MDFFEFEDTFITNNAIKLFNFIGENDSYTAKLCYWIISTLDTDYEGECIYDLMPPIVKGMSLKESKKLNNEVAENIMKKTIDILLKCSGNLLNPNNNSVLTLTNDLLLNDDNCIDKGNFGQIHLVNGYAVKCVYYKDLSLELNCLMREVTVLSMLNRLKFIGMNNDLFYIGMEYLPYELKFNDVKKAMKDLANELFIIHSLGIIHCDIKLQNIRIDSNGIYRLIDFGSCRFTPSKNVNAFIGTEVYRDYLLYKEDSIHSYEIDIWSLGVVFYILEMGSVPWKLPIGTESIEAQWTSSMKHASNLVCNMLQLDKDKRINIQDLLKCL
jgi:serine/threonine protein kinase